MKEDSKNVKSPAETPSKKEGPCAGGVSQNGKTFRMLKSQRDRRVKLRVPIRKGLPPFDPTAWYLYEVERNKELASRELLNDPTIGFDVEAYVAVQIKVRRKAKTDQITREERVVIHGKIFVRTPEEHRVEVMKKCPYIKKCVINPVSSSRNFARIPNSQIEDAKGMLEEDEESMVCFSTTPPKVNDDVHFIGGPLSLGGLEGDIKAKVAAVGKQYAMVAIEGVGYLWKVPVKDLAKHHGKK